MPRANHPIDKVLEYFRTAPLDAAEQALHVARNILKERSTANVRETNMPLLPAKPRKKRGPNKPKVPPVQTLTAPAPVDAKG